MNLSSIDLSADDKDVPSSDYTVSFSPSSFALSYDEPYSTAATLTACGTTTRAGVNYVYATFAVIASGNEAIVNKRNGGLKTETATLIVGATLGETIKLERKDIVSYEQEPLEGSGSKISLCMYLLFSMPFIMFLF
ncbi:unnamed protein product [[Candida] boidinii]|nr:unnamed protein product [[Candida] boidinii]